MSVQIIIGDVREQIRKLPSSSVHCVVTSPPYWGLRDYGVDGQIGLEETPQQFVDEMVSLFREVRRVLRDDGTLWFNMGDSYANDGKFGGMTGGKQAYLDEASLVRCGREKRVTGLKPKDLVGIPWRCAFALQADGWYLRQDIIWHKPNPMPESCGDRCTKAHEYVFLLTKSPRYFYDADAIAENRTSDEDANGFRGGSYVGGATDNATMGNRTAVGNKRVRGTPPRHAAYESCDQSGLDSVGRGGRRNKRSVWTVATQPFSEAHFATFPPALIEPCIKAATSERGCCRHCGAGLERVTIEVETGRTQKMPDGMATYAGSHSAIHKEGREKGAADNPVLASETIGFYPTCRCEGLPRLPSYPKKPGRVGAVDEAAYKSALAAWRAECRVVDGRCRELCAGASNLMTARAVVLDPFGGAGTTGLVADRLQRDAILIELNPTYAAMARRRIDGDSPLFAAAAE